MGARLLTAAHDGCRGDAGGQLQLCWFEYASIRVCELVELEWHWGKRYRSAPGVYSQAALRYFM